MAQEKMVELAGSLKLLVRLICRNDKVDIGTFWEVATSDDFSLSADELDDLISQISTKIPLKRLGFCDKLQHYMIDKSNQCPHYLRTKVAYPLVIGLYKDLQREREYGSYNDDSLSCFMNYSYYFCLQLAGSDSIGLAKKLFRLLGQMASDVLIIRILQAHTGIPEEFANALAEGAIKRHGPRQVFEKICTLVSDEDKVGLLKAAFRAAHMSGKDANPIFGKLVDLIGQEAAEEWLRDEFPQTVGSD